MTTPRQPIEPAEALSLVLENARLSAPESLPLLEAVSLILAEEIPAEHDLPPFDRATMDGYGVRLADAGRSPRVVAVVPAGRPVELVLEDGDAVEIMTGAPCPQGVEAVVKVESTTRDGDRVRLPSTLERGRHIVARGSEHRAGAPLLSKGARLTPLAIAAAATAGRATVRVIPRPRVAVISTGAELTRPGEVRVPGRIRDSNRPMMAALLLESGLGEPSDHSVTDDRKIIDETLRGILAGEPPPHVLVLSGGVSVGRFDLVPEALLALGAEVVFHGVRQRPGKPLLFARLGERLIFGLPGNPLSVLAGFHGYVAPALRHMMGLPATRPPFSAHLDGPFQTTSERHQRVLAEVTSGADGELIARPLIGKGSGDLSAVQGANAYLMFNPGHHRLRAGAEVRGEWLK